PERELARAHSVSASIGPLRQRLGGWGRRTPGTLQRVAFRPIPVSCSRPESRWRLGAGKRGPRLQPATAGLAVARGPWTRSVVGGHGRGRVGPVDFASPPAAPAGST